MTPEKKKKKREVVEGEPQELSKEEALNQPSNRGGILTFLLQFSKYLSLYSKEGKDIETCLQEVLKQIGQQLQNHCAALIK